MQDCISSLVPKPFLLVLNYLVFAFQVRQLVFDEMFTLNDDKDTEFVTTIFISNLLVFVMISTSSESFKAATEPEQATMSFSFEEFSIQYNTWNGISNYEHDQITSLSQTIYNIFNFSMETQTQKLKDQLQRCNQDISSLKTQKERLEKQMIALLQQNNQLKDKILEDKQLKEIQNFKAENQKLNIEISLLRRQNQKELCMKDKEKHNAQIVRLNNFISERQESYMQVVAQVQQLKKIITQQQSTFNERKQKQLKDKIQLQKRQLQRQKLQLDRLSLQLSSNMNSSKNVHKSQQLRNAYEHENGKNGHELFKFNQQNTRLMGQLTHTQGTLSLIHCESINSETQYKKEDSSKNRVPGALKYDIFQSQIQSGQESQWRIKQYEWQKERLKMEVEINRLKSQLYNAQEISQSALRDQADKYQKHISLLNNTIATLTLKIEQFENIVEEKKTPAQRINTLCKKIKRYKNTINELRTFKQKFLQTELLNKNLNYDIINLKEQLINAQKNYNKNMIKPSDVSKINQLDQNPLFHHEQIDQQKSYSERMCQSSKIPKFEGNLIYQKWLNLQQKIQKITYENNFLKRACSNYNRS